MRSLSLSPDGERRTGELAVGIRHRLVELVGRDQPAVAPTVAVDRVVVDEARALNPDQHDVVVAAVRRLRSAGQLPELDLRDDDPVLTDLLADLVERPV